MSWREEYAQLLSFLDACSITFPVRTFNNTPEKDSTPVRRIAFALENMIDQLKKPLVPSTQALAQSLIYKFNGPHRRQGYWMNFKNLSRSLRKYNEDDLLKRVSDIHRKAMASSAGFYMPSNEVIRYIGSSYLKRLFRLQQIRDLCIRTSHVIMGQLELGHWEKFSLFIVAMCADISHGISKQASGISSVYEKIAGLLTFLDGRGAWLNENRFRVSVLCSPGWSRTGSVGNGTSPKRRKILALHAATFPSSLSELSVFSNLCEKISAQKTVDTARVMRLLQMDDEQLEAARSKDQMAMFRDEVLSSIDLKNDSIDLGTTIERVILEDKEFTIDIPITEIKSASTTDSGLEVDFEAPAMASISPTNELTVLTEKKQKKRLRKRKRKERHTVDHLSLECLSSTVFENSEDELSKDVENVEALLTKSKRRHSVKVMESMESELDSQSVNSPSLTSSSAPVNRKKKRLKKNSLSHTIISTDFELTTESSGPIDVINFARCSATSENKVRKHQLNSKNPECDAGSRKRRSTDIGEKSLTKVLPRKKKKRLTIA